MRGIVRIVAAAAVLMAAGTATAAPIPVTIAELWAHPKRYDGKEVRVRGQVDACGGIDCEFCPETMTRAEFAATVAQGDLEAGQCLQVGFESYERSPVGDIVSDRMDHIFRLSTVTIEATFDPACLPGGTLFCMDRVNALREARVLEVHARRVSDQALDTHYSRNMVPADANLTQQILRVYDDSVPPNWRNNRPRKVFLSDDEGFLTSEEVDHTAFVCVCREDSCEGRWPKRWLESLADPFACYELGEWGGRWRLVPRRDFAAGD